MLTAFAAEGKGFDVYFKQHTSEANAFDRLL